MDRTNVFLLKYLSLQKVASHLEIQLKICSHNKFIIPQSISNIIFSFVKGKYSFLNEYETEFFSYNHTRLTMCDINTRDMTRFENFGFLKDHKIEYLRICGKQEFNRSVKDLYPFQIRNLRLECLNLKKNYVLNEKFPTNRLDWEYFFNSLKSLQCLSINESSFNNDESIILFKFLCSNSNKLEQLKIRNSSFDINFDEELLNLLLKGKFFKKLNLTGLVFSKNHILNNSNIKLDKNTYLNNLKLDLSSFGQENCLVYVNLIRNMENLKNLTLKFHNLNNSKEINNFLENLGENLNLRKINFKFNFSKEINKFLQFILSLKNLESLHLNFNSFKDQDYFFDSLSSIKYLKRLTVNFGIIENSNPIVNLIKNQENLKKLKIFNRFEKPEYLDSNLIKSILENIPFLPKLSKLNLAHFSYSNGNYFESLAHFINRQKNLVHLVFESVTSDNFVSNKIFFSILSTSTRNITRLAFKKCYFSMKWNFLKYIIEFILAQRNLSNLSCKDMTDISFRKFILKVVSLGTIPFIHLNNHDSLYLFKNYYVKVSEDGFNTLILNR